MLFGGNQGHGRRQKAEGIFSQSAPGFFTVVDLIDPIDRIDLIADGLDGWRPAGGIFSQGAAKFFFDGLCPAPACFQAFAFLFAPP